MTPYVLTGATEAERRAERRRLNTQPQPAVKPIRPTTIPADLLTRLTVWPHMTLQQAADAVADLIDQERK